MKPVDPKVLEDPEAFAQLVFETCDRLQPKLPHIDREDLVLIVQSVLRPPGTGRRFFLRPTGSGGHVF